MEADEATRPESAENDEHRLRRLGLLPDMFAAECSALRGHRPDPLVEVYREGLERLAWQLRDAQEALDEQRADLFQARHEVERLSRAVCELADHWLTPDGGPIELATLHHRMVRFVLHQPEPGVTPEPDMTWDQVAPELRTTIARLADEFGATGLVEAAEAYRARMRRDQDAKALEAARAAVRVGGGGAYSARGVRPGDE